MIAIEVSAVIIDFIQHPLHMRVLANFMNLIAKGKLPTLVSSSIDFQSKHYLDLHFGKVSFCIFSKINLLF